MAGTPDDRRGDAPRPVSDGAYRRHRTAQLRRGRQMTPAQRLRWLEQTVEQLSRWRGRARAAPPSD